MARGPSATGALLTDYYRVPGTAGSAAAALELRPPPPGRDPELEAGLTLELSVSLKALAGELEREREWRQRIADGIMPVEVPAIGAFTPAQAPYLQGTWGPKDGFFWAVQRLTVATLAAGDVLQVYRGTSTADANGAQNLLNSWQASNGAVQTWNPGRTGCMLAAKQTLVFTGTLAAGPYMANADVIQLESWLLPYFLL